ncbi:hypothetical protein R3P38DRAFT_2857163, partial [Favolaschia claudopus]
ESAVVAASGDGHELITLAEREGPSIQKFLLALLYKNLSTTAPLIPRLEQALDSAGTNDELRLLEACASRVLHSLWGVSLLRYESLDHGAFRDVWPTGWKWIHFLDKYRELIAAVLPSFDVPHLYYTSMSFIGTLADDTWVADVLDTQCQPRKLFARAWVCLLDSDYAIDHFSFRYLGINMRRSTEGFHGPWDEIIEGVGGEKAVLAAIVVDYVERVTSHATISLDLQYLAFVAYLIQGLFTDAHFMESLCEQGAVKIITCAICKLAPDLCSTESIEGLYALLGILRFCIRTGAGYHWVAHSLRSGLVSAIALCGPSGSMEDAYPEWLDWLVQTMTHGLLFKSVLLEVRAEWPNITAAHNTLQGHTIFEKWDIFTRLAGIQLEVLAAYEEGEFPRHRVCSNAKCAMVAEKTNFRRCSACSVSLYCSTVCQRQDWRLGQHLDYCRRYKFVQLSAPSGHDAQERSFLRAVLSESYMLLRRTAMKRRIEVARCFPGRTPLFLFDFTRPSAAYSMHCMFGVLPDNDHTRIFVDMVQRSGGRLELHAMRIQQGGIQSRSYLIPLHFDTGATVATLEKLATAESPETDIAEIEKILHSTAFEVYGDFLGDLEKLGISLTLATSDSESVYHCSG